ncbi:MAG: FkbM family methyltransferase [Dehalococcoidia bacterium]|nr:FkbM family methyltransferase [Dehalococcoidia bacterium]
MSELVSLTIPDSIQEFPLKPDSIIFIVGGFEGKHAQYYVDKYDPHVYIFEPQTELTPVLKQRFANSPKVKVIQAGLGDKSGTFEMSRIGTDRASFIHRLKGVDNGEDTFVGPYGKGRIIEIGEFMRGEGIKQIDLLLGNCEGYEFILLPWLAKTKLAEKIKYLMVQFHMHHEGNESLPDIKKALSATHKIRDNYEPAWIVWEKKVVKKTKKKVKK